MIHSACLSELPHLPATGRHVVVQDTVQFAASGLGSAAAPLLEEERNVGDSALVAQVSHPHRVHGTGTGSTLAPGDQPAHAAQIEVVQRTQQGLGADEPDGCWDRSEVIDSEGVALGFDAHAYPEGGRGDERHPASGGCGGAAGGRIADRVGRQGSPASFVWSHS